MSGLKRIIPHWSVTKYGFNSLSDKHYHYSVNGIGEVKAGDLKPEANISTKTKYAAHTKGCNTGSIGIACMAMFGAKSAKNFGPYPITRAQFEGMCEFIAELCIKYDIAVSPKTVLTHAEVEPNLGIKQRGKWDIAVLPHVNLVGAKACGDYMRKRVRFYMGDHTIGKDDAKATSGDARTRWLQRLVSELGYDLGTPDGVLGSKTYAAIGEFQLANDLPPTRIFDRPTIDLLKSGKGLKKPSPKPKSVVQPAVTTKPEPRVEPEPIGFWAWFRSLLSKG